MLTRAIVAALAVAGLTAGTAVAAPKPSQATNWETSSGNVSCGIARIHGTAIDAAMGTPLTGLWPGLQCSAPGIKRAPGSSVGDPFVQLGQGTAGRAKLVDLSENDLIYNRAPTKLTAGSSWSRYGITCAVKANAITCRNSSGHGFALSPGKLSVH